MFQATIFTAQHVAQLVQLDIMRVQVQICVFLVPPPALLVLQAKLLALHASLAIIFLGHHVALVVHLDIMRAQLLTPVLHVPLHAQPAHLV